MKIFTKSLATVALGAALSLAAAHSASAYQVSVSTANTGGSGFDASASTTLSNAISATFTYTGPLSFSNTSPQNNNSSGDLNSAFFANGTISGYSGSGSLSGPANANFSTLATFLASSGSASNFQYGSLYKIDLGMLAAGTDLTITHDDGASVYQGGIRVGNTTSGPTTAVTESVRLASSGETFLYYARENGTPSVLNVAVPEPMSLGLLGAGLAGLGLIRRKRTVQAA